MPTQHPPSTHDITVHHVYHQSPRLNGCLVLFLLCGTAVGVLFFGLLALHQWHYGQYALVLLGLAGVGGLLYGLFSYLKPYA